MSGHVCQTAAETIAGDPDFPEEFISNPWCWYTAGGFHRAKSSRTARRNVRIEKGTQCVTANSMTAALAISLGAGLGTSNGHPAGSLGPGITRMHEVTEYDFYQGSAEMWAKFGHAASYTGRALNEVGHLQKYLRILIREMVLQRKAFAGRAELERMVDGQASAADIDVLRHIDAIEPVVRVLEEDCDYPGVVRSAYRIYTDDNPDASSAVVDNAIRKLTGYLNTL